MLTKEQIERFYSEVERLALRFPVASISAKTSEPKSNVSKYLNRKLEPSESFIERFYVGFKDELLKSYKNVPRETSLILGEKEGEYNKPAGFTIIEAQEDANDYLKKRLAQKNNSGPYMVPLVPVKAQAGYSKGYNNTDFLNKLDYYPILPGIDPHGAAWRYFEMQGESMEETFKDGQYLLTSQVIQEDWRNIDNYYVYVIITDEKVMVKRLAKVKGKDYWAAISDNEEKFPQFKLPVNQVCELWKYRRHIDWDASPKKKFEIKV